MRIKMKSGSMMIVALLSGIAAWGKTEALPDESETIIVESEQVLGECLTSIQRLYFPVCLPSLSARLLQPAGSFPVDFSRFSPKVRREFLGRVDENFIVHYSVGLYEDYWTGEVVVMDANSGRELFRIPRDKSYDPYAMQREFFNLGEGEVLADEFSRGIFLPSKIATVVDLVPLIFWDAHVRIEQEIAAEERAVELERMADAPVESDQVVVSMSVASPVLFSEPLMSALSSPPAPPSGDGGESGGGGGSGTNLEVTLTLSLPEGFGHMNHIEIFAKDSLMDSSWALPADGEWIPTYGSQTVVWTDSESTNKSQRFYLISDGTDSDGDGHSDLYEVLEGNTVSNSFDLVNTDGDDLHDWLELKIFGDLSQTGTNDFDSDGLLNNEELVSLSANHPAIMLSDPSLYDSDDEGLNDFAERRVWHTDPFDSDTDDDGIDDAAEVLGTIRTDPNNADTVAPSVIF